MAWIELHQTLPKNKKTLKFKRRLKIKTPQAIGHLCLLWLWALDNAEDGNLADFSVEDIAEVCEWTKEPQELIDALIDAGFLDKSMQIHDWDEYIGRLVVRREVKKEQTRARQQRYRERLKTKNDHNADVTQDNALVTRYIGVSNAPNPTVPNLTQPYPTQPIYSGGGGDACACACEDPDFDDDDADRPRDVESIIEDASNRETWAEDLAALSQEIRERFYRAADPLYRLWGVAPEEKDYLLLWGVVKYMHNGRPILIDDDFVELLTEIFSVASRSGHENIAYLFGIARRLRSRGISSVDQYWEFQAKRDMSGGRR